MGHGSGVNSALTTLEGGFVVSDSLRKRSVFVPPRDKAKKAPNPHHRSCPNGYVLKFALRSQSTVSVASVLYSSCIRFPGL